MLDHRYGGNSATIKDSEIVYVKDGGCDLSEYINLEIKDKIVLFEPSKKCSLFEGSFALEKLGASAVLISTPKSAIKPSFARVRIVDWKEGDPLMNIPVLSLTFSTFKTLLAGINNGARVDLVTNTEIKVVTTSNVICEGRAGNPNNTIVIGSHLDSVAFGPGMNDNASGSAATLEIFLQISKMSRKKTLNNRLVFIWFGSEEDGLLGSRHFVRELQKSSSPHESHVRLEQIALNLNFDMIASPNYIPMIHNGSDAPSSARCGSIVVQRMFEKYFKKVADRKYKITDMVAGSDFVPFMNAGIPTGGILTGASEIKNEEERILYGGIANAQLDPCYHKDCDTINNVNEEALGLMSKGAMYTISNFAQIKDLRNQLAKCS
ncbi:Aminopeptidase [Smittium mucronatum]|uniref:Peptide hydrolase n=1 Tax=Smittium mucronatum TaxID=133383 RepID=A0A1R0H6S8_9FUNG|nr:Aminopeptidase [Smittium mucronatum]